MAKKRKAILDEFMEKHHLYELFTEKIESLIKTILNESNIKIHTITSRTKDIGSLQKKILKKKKKYNSYRDITDLSGVRIICFSLEQVDIVAEKIKENFTIIPKYSIDKRELLDPDRFGYLSLHYVVKISKNRERLTEYSRYKGLFCEIQIRTLLQHTWAEIEHDLDYKSEIALPKYIKRRFYRLAGLLELADDEFTNVIKNTNDYSVNIVEKIKTDPGKVLIDKISLTGYLETSDIVLKITNKICEYTGCKLSKKAYLFDELIILKFLKITNIYELDKLINEHSQQIIDFACNLMGSERDVDAFLDLTIPVHYLGYILASKTQDLEYIEDYLNNLEIPKSKQFVKQLITMYKDISNKK